MSVCIHVWPSSHSSVYTHHTFALIIAGTSHKCQTNGSPWCAGAAVASVDAFNLRVCAITSSLGDPNRAVHLVITYAGKTTIAQ